MDNKLKSPQTSKPKTEIIYNCTYMTFWKWQNPGNGKILEMKIRSVVAKRLRKEKS